MDPLIALLFLFLLSSATCKKAIICIGPWTPVTDSFRSFLLSSVSDLNDNGFSYTHFSYGMQKHEDIENQLYAAIATSAQSNKNILVQADVLYEFQEGDILKLESALAAGDFVTSIVWIFQDGLSHIQATYAENVNRNKVLPTYITYLHFRSDYAVRFGGVTSYAEIFGRQNIIALDYNGVMSRERDLAHVVLCEIMGVLCDVTTLRNGPPTAEAIKPLTDTYYASLLFMMLSYAEQAGCVATEPEQVQNVRLHLEKRLRDAVSSKALVVPEKVFDLSILATPMVLMDTSFYEHSIEGIEHMQWYYRDEHANAVASHAFRTFREIRVWDVEMDPSWQNWMRNEVALMREFNDHFLNC